MIRETERTGERADQRSGGYLRRLQEDLDEIAAETDQAVRDEKIAPLVRTIHQTIGS